MFWACRKPATGGASPLYIKYSKQRGAGGKIEKINLDIESNGWLIGLTEMVLRGWVDEWMVEGRERGAHSDTTDRKYRHGAKQRPKRLRKRKTTAKYLPGNILQATMTTTPLAITMRATRYIE